MCMQPQVQACIVCVCESLYITMKKTKRTLGKPDDTAVVDGTYHS